MKKRQKSILRAGAVLLVAVSAGHFVQSLDDKKLAAVAPAKPTEIVRVSAGPEAVDAAQPVLEVPLEVAMEASETGADLPIPVTPALAEAEAAAAPILAALPQPAEAVAVGPLPADARATEPAVTPEAPPAAAEIADVGPQDCTPSLTLSAAPQAMIAVALSAPCRQGERVVLRHAGLAVAEALSAEGDLILDLPALQADAQVSILFADAETLHASIEVPSAAMLHRTAVQWIADDAFQIYALENGADYGEPGAVWSGAPASANGGYLVALGDPTLDLPMRAEIYTAPSMGKIDLSIEANVTEVSCGRELLGEVLELKDGQLSINELTLAMPDCDAIGDILVLKNPGQDMTLASVE
ncbi:hypothetical protein Q9295_01895 [Xinfangfangia sp. CPCC 101601]|uniref:Translocase n=1 Tax=Pseudogemmobacter lacusdianii TaxID=3069608 RepID=A0ABU0VTR4_9RHOB|nr:hypothetical protein [Xinfangfangia sp. CPCC 101601]MDQ2065111.1 hypothetical protein [Xinfangfangia sp. CPCC 101601]